jgi:tRNA nucleotidyltransferase (CCA-adding enzyme)
MPPNATNQPLDPAAAAALLWQRLALQRWPLPLEALPSGCALVGGAVRDGLLNRLGSHQDLDLVVPTAATSCNELGRRLARRLGGSMVVLDAERDIARVVLGPWNLDLAAQAGGSLEADLTRRDYRINAMALPLDPQAPLVDPCNGLADLAAGQLHAVSEANLLDDPLRLLRGPRLAAELQFQLDAPTATLLRRHRTCLAQVAPERVLAELEKLAATPGAEAGLALAQELGLLDAWLEPLAGAALAQELAGANLTAEEAASALPLARLAALFSAAGLARLRSSRRLQQRCQRLRHWALRLGASEPLGEAEMLQLCRELEADLPALVLLAAAATQGWLQRWRDPADPLFHPRPPFDGGTLQSELGLPPGPALGQLLERLTLARAFGRPHDLEAAKGLCRPMP